MTRDESKEILMSIQAAYPNYKPQDKTIAINTWFYMLEAYTYAQVSVALKNYILSDTSGFAPSIGQLIGKLHTNEIADELNEIAAWGFVRRAIQRSAYYAEEEFSKLPLVVQKSIGNPDQLKEWATMEDIDGRALNVMQSNFMRTFRVEQERQKERSKLSPNLVKMINNSVNDEKIQKKEYRALSISEEREVFLKDAVPAPEGLIEKAKCFF